jgi:hypothetical protein
VRGRLEDEDGRVIGRSDDRPDDWNLQIAATLAPGSYQLRLEPVGRPTASTTVSLRRREEKQEVPLAAPAEADLNPGTTAHLYPRPAPRPSSSPRSCARATP